jgi:hypothetical protein
VLSYYIKGFLEAFLGDKPHVGGDVRPKGAPSLAGRRNIVRIVMLIVIFLEYEILGGCI